MMPVCVCVMMCVCVSCDMGAYVCYDMYAIFAGLDSAATTLFSQLVLEGFNSRAACIQQGASTIDTNLRI